MNCTQIEYEVADGVCTITLARPDKLNAFTGTMGDELYEAFRQAHADPQVRAIVLTGAGSAFCAGVDMKALADPAEATRIVATPFLSRFPRENYRSTKPTICAINGPAIGVGITMALSFDLRIAAEDAKLAVPFTKLGMLPGLGSTYLLPRLVGRGAALDLLLSGRTISAAEARDIGLVERTVAPGTALEVALGMARDLAQRNPAVLAGVKEAVNFGAEHTLEEAMDNEEALIAKLRFTKRTAGAS
jgi:enoyl-CoA hydratase/carnithine racemase